MKRHVEYSGWGEGDGKAQKSLSAALGVCNATGWLCLIYSAVNSSEISSQPCLHTHMFRCTRALLAHINADTQMYSMHAVLSDLATDGTSRLHRGSNPSICIIIFNELSPWSVKIHKDLYSLLWHLKVNICIVHFKLDVQCLLKIMEAGSLVCLMISFLIIVRVQKIQRAGAWVLLCSPENGKICRQSHP